jgi:uncharacterized LabA/DUF88 family protein
MKVSFANRAALFIDGPNLYSTAKAPGFDVDYKRLLKEFQSHGTLVRVFYYTAVTEDQEFSSVRPLLDWLDYNGFTVVTKPAKEFIDANGHRKVKGSMDVEITVDAMERADRVDQIVLFSGGGDFTLVGRSCAATRHWNVYVMANYKETQLTRVPGQPVDTTVDSFRTKNCTAAPSGSRRRVVRNSHFVTRTPLVTRNPRHCITSTNERRLPLPENSTL